MTLKQWVQSKILNFLGLQRLADNPNDERHIYINNDDEIKMEFIKAAKIWLTGDSNELANYYTAAQQQGFTKNQVYNRNNYNYFWSKSVHECNIKRIHSGIPNAIATTTSNVVGFPTIECDGQEIWNAIAKENNFEDKLTQEIRPLTLVTGCGGAKINFNKDLSDYPLWEFYDGEYVEYIIKSGILMGMIFKSYYKDKHDKNYVLVETRYRANKNSYIEYQLFKCGKSDELEPVSLDTLPELADIPREPTVIEGLNMVLGVPFRYFRDSQNPKGGKSIYAGKLDIFDFMDEILSQASQTNRVSTPVTWVNPDVMRRGMNGTTGYENLYNRQIIMKDGIPDGDGFQNTDIVTEQPNLDFEKYMSLFKETLDVALTGVLSPASLGIDISKKDNAEAQREKEKITITTRDTIIVNEKNSLEDMVKLSLYIEEYMRTGKITLNDYNINITYKGFANPSTETMLPVLGGAWSQGQISTERYVNLLWPDDTEEEKQKEIQWLDNNKQQDDFDMNALMGAGNETGAQPDFMGQAETEEPVEE